jgi:hypothetical protein
VVEFPSGLPSFDEKQFSDAAWDSAVTTHELSVRVTDVVFGKGWFTLVHDSTDGILLSLLEEKALAFNLTFPPDVAVRIVLDVLEGLELSRAQSDAAQLNWRPGSVSPHSLNLCRDGRTRALDGHVAAAALHLVASGSSKERDIIVPPEVLTDPTNASERVDVFMVGALLWGLLTGRRLDITQDYSEGYADISRVVPVKVSIAKGLVQTIAQALMLAPNQRQGSLRELTVALVMSAEKVATYPEVIDFVDALILLDSSRIGVKTDENPPAPGASAIDAPVSDASAPRVDDAPPAPDASASDAPVIDAPAPRVDEAPPAPGASASDAPVIDASVPDASASDAPVIDAPAPRVDEAPPAPAALSAPARLAMISWAEDDLTRVGAPKPRDADEQNHAPATKLGEISESQSSVSTAESSGVGEPISKLAESGESESSKSLKSAQSVEAIPSIAIESSIDWDNVDASKPRERQSTLPGTGTVKTAESKEPLATPEAELATPETSSRASGGKAASKPLVTRAALTSNRPPKTDKPLEEPRSMRPPPSDAVKEVLLALEKKSTSKAPPAVESEFVHPPILNERKLQISMSTLVLGFSTTVLAVIVIMLLVLRSPSAPTHDNAPVRAQNPVEAKSERVAPPQPLMQPSEAKSGEKTEEPQASSPLGSAAPANSLKTSTKPRTLKSSTSPNNKAASSGNNEAATETGASGQKHPKNYVPNDL